MCVRGKNMLAKHMLAKRRLGDQRLKLSGVTLVETLVTLAILALVVGLAVPSLQSFYDKNRTSSRQNELIASIQLARSESIKRGVGVAICVREDASTCRASGADKYSYPWEQGWLVFHGSAADPQVIYQFNGWVEKDPLRYRSNFKDGVIQFTPLGYVSGVGGTLVYCGQDGFELDNPRTIAIGSNGRPRQYEEGELSATDYATFCPDPGV